MVIRVAGQDCHWEERGAWTGALAPSLLADAGATLVIIGYSERRQHFGETEERVGKKVAAALAAGLVPILCVGEIEAERDAGATFRRIEIQFEGGLAAVADETLL